MTMLHIVNVPFEKQNPELTLCLGCDLNGYEPKRNLISIPYLYYLAHGHCILEVTLSHWQLGSELKSLLDR